MTESDNDFELPRLHEGLQLEKGPRNADGSPTFTLHNPASNKYYKLEWAEFECLSRFHKHQMASSLEQEIARQTSLNVSRDDIHALVRFLRHYGLVTLADQRKSGSLKKDEAPLHNAWLRFFKTYLFFRIPLINPQRLLENLYPKLSFALTKPFVYSGLALLVSGFALVLQRLDEFMATFVYMFSIPGLITTLVVFAFIKIIHEMTHALTAHKYSVDVPHMGVAFIICYPVLYTEVSGAWRLQDRFKRLLIGLSGVLSELLIAGIFLVLWSFHPQGLIGSISFTVVVISLISSLLINLNPLMRFDGYYVLADWLGLDNLQFRAIAFARWQLRQWLFKLNDPRPEPAPDDLQKFLIWFGFALLVYRALLFIGIAIALYLIFFKPLGLILMLLELALLIFWPVARELKIWWERRQDIIQTKRSRVTFAVLIGLVLFAFIPVKSDVRAPAVLTAKDYRAIYPPVPSEIEALHVSPSQMVKQGDMLVDLAAPELDYQIEKARLNLEKARTHIRLFNVTSGNAGTKTGEPQNLALQAKVEQAQENLNQLLENKKRLNVKAPFNGVVRDVNPDIHAGIILRPSDFILRVVATDGYNMTAYLSETDIARIRPGDKGHFFPHHSLTMHFPAVVENVSQSNVENLAWLSLASIYGGDIPAVKDNANGAASNGGVALRRNKYQVSLNTSFENLSPRQKNYLRNNSYVIHGYVRVSGDSTSFFSQATRSLSALIRQEMNVN